MNFLRIVRESQYSGSETMPAAPRPKGKATKIAYAVLGKPQNQYDKKNERDQKIDERLLYYETRLVK